MIPSSVMRRRRQPLELEVRRLQEALQARAEGRNSAEVDLDLPALLASIWRARGAASFTVSEIRDQGIVTAADARRLGFALADLAASSDRVGQFVVERQGPSNLGRLWRLHRR